MRHLLEARTIWPLKWFGSLSLMIRTISQTKTQETKWTILLNISSPHSIKSSQSMLISYLLWQLDWLTNYGKMRDQTKWKSCKTPTISRINSSNSAYLYQLFPLEYKPLILKRTSEYYILWVLQVVQPLQCCGNSHCVINSTV